MTFEDFFQGALRRGDCIEREKDAMRCAWQAARRTVSGQEAQPVALWGAFATDGNLLAHSKLRPGLSDILNWEPLYRAAPIPATELSAWISVTDRRPEKTPSREQVLVRLDSGVVRLETPYFDDEGQYFLMERDPRVTAKVTHWMTLPEAPTEIDK